MTEKSVEPLARTSEVALRPLEPIHRMRPPQFSPPAEDLTAWYWRMLKLGARSIVTWMVLGTLVGFFVVTPEAPTYRVSTTIEIQGLNENFMNIQAVNPTNAPGTPETNMQTQVRILQSASVVERSLAALNQKLFEGGTKPRGIPRTDLISQAIASMGYEFRAPIPVEDAVSELPKKLQVRPLGTSRLVEISTTSVDPKLAADFINILAAEFTTFMQETRWSAAQSTNAWLSRQLVDVRKRLLESEQQLQSFMSTSAMLYTTGESVNADRLRKLQTDLSEAQGEMLSRQATYVTAAAAATVPDTDPDDNMPARDLRLRRAELQRDLARLSVTMRPDHPRVQELMVQIEQIEKTINDERGRDLSRLRRGYETAAKRVSLVKDQYDRQYDIVTRESQNAVRYNMLKQEVDASRNLYEAMKQRVNEAGIASALQTSTVQVVDRAIPPIRPVSPKPLEAAIWGAVGGSLFGLALTFFRHRVATVIRLPGEVPTQLAFREMAVIPSVVGEPRLTLANPRRSWLAFRPALEGGMVRPKRDPVAAESFRSAVVSLQAAFGHDLRKRTFLVSSPRSGDGKSMVSSNLAIALSECASRVLLIDADMHRPQVHRIFKISNDGPGLAKYLADTTAPNLSELVFETDFPGLYVLPTDTAENTMQLLHTKRMGELLRAAQLGFDVVIIDTPPVLDASEARMLVRLSDGLLMVFRSGKTNRHEAQAACELIVEDGGRILGTILNDLDSRLISSYRYHGYRNYR